MGLDVGIIRIEYRWIPRGLPYQFAWELVHEASVNGYMSGSDNNWAPFTQAKVLRLLDEFVKSKRLDIQGRKAILRWVRSLPWEHWKGGLDPVGYPPEDEDDQDDPRTGGFIELHFNW